MSDPVFTTLKFVKHDGIQPVVELTLRYRSSRIVHIPENTHGVFLGTVYAYVPVVDGKPNMDATTYQVNGPMVKVDGEPGLLNKQGRIIDPPEFVTVLVRDLTQDLIKQVKESLS